MRWGKPDGTKLADLPIRKTGQAWYYSQRYEQVRAAIRTGILPSAFDALSGEDKAYIVAYWRTVDRMESYENQIAIEEAERAAKAK